MQKNTLFRNPDKMWNKRNIKDVKEKRKIALVGTGSGVGVSFLTGALASFFSCRTTEAAVAVVELGSSYFYEAYGIEKRFVQRDFIRFYEHLLLKESIRGLRNIEENINWVLRCPSEARENQMRIGDALRLVNHVEGSLLLFDCSSVAEELLWDILPEMDAIVAVIDPLPSKLLPGGELIRRLQFVFPATLFVVNKINQGIHQGELKRFLKGFDCYPMPLVCARWMYQAEYNCVLPYTIAPVKAQIDQPLRTLSSTLMQRADSPYV